MTKQNRFLNYSLFLMVSISLLVGGCVMSGSKPSSSKKVPVELTFPPPPDEPRFYFERSIHSSADVEVDDENDRLRRLLTGEVRRGQGLSKPYSIVARKGRLYVGDTVHKAVAVFDFLAQKFFWIGEEDDENGNGRLGMPLGIDLDKEGNLYVFDGKLKQIIVYDWDGKYLRSIGIPNEFQRPAGLAVDPDGKRVYAVDIGGSSSNQHKIFVFDGQSGAHLFDIGKRGIGEGEFNLPRDVAIAPDGSIYVVDGGNFRVQKFSADGKFIKSFGAIGRQPGQFSRPKELAIDPAGNVYVVDAAFGNFQIWNPEGQLLLAVGSRSNIDLPAKFGLPSGIAVDEDGRVYMADQYFRKVDIFRPAALDEDDGIIGKKAIEKASLSRKGSGGAKPGETKPGETKSGGADQGGAGSLPPIPDETLPE